MKQTCLTHHNLMLLRDCKTGWTRSTINFSSFRSPRPGLYFIFFFATKLLVSYLSLTQQNTGAHLSLLHSSFLECLVHINQHPKYQPERWLKQKRLYELNQEFNKIGVFSLRPLGKQLSHLACLGSLVAYPSKWFTCIYKMTCISPCPLGKQANKVICPARISLPIPDDWMGEFFELFVSTG